MAREAPASTVDDAETARFAALAAEWWNPRGPLRPLHALNPVRLRYVRDRLAGHFGRDPVQRRPLDGLRVLDLGCGGGLLSEPLARLGATVIGADAAAENVVVALQHARQSGLAIDYRATTAEALAGAGERFDAVLAMEIVEHVAEVDLFLRATARLVAPGGALLLATLNRTARSFLLAKVGAEYLLRWLPIGTHDWRRFLRPSEIAAPLRHEGLTVQDVTGVVYSPLLDEWRLSGDVSVNYMIFAVRP